MKEWITGRNSVMEVLQAKRRQVFRLLFATGVEEKGRIVESAYRPGDRRFRWKESARERLDKMGENPQGIALK